MQPVILVSEYRPTHSHSNQEENLKKIQSHSKAQLQDKVTNTVLAWSKEEDPKHTRDERKQILIGQNIVKSKSVFFNLLCVWIFFFFRTLSIQLCFSLFFVLFWKKSKSSDDSHSKDLSLGLLRKTDPVHMLLRTAVLCSVQHYILTNILCRDVLWGHWHWHCQNCSQGPPAEKTGTGSLLNRPSCSPWWGNQSWD